MEFITPSVADPVNSLRATEKIEIYTTVFGAHLSLNLATPTFPTTAVISFIIIF